MGFSAPADHAEAAVVGDCGSELRPGRHVHAGKHDWALYTEELCEGGLDGLHGGMSRVGREGVKRGKARRRQVSCFLLCKEVALKD
eukprot:COSAG05_NODE_28_length_29121_cov_56.951933_27_plen_86_part_00